MGISVASIADHDRDSVQMIAEVRPAPPFSRSQAGDRSARLGNDVAV